MKKNRWASASFMAQLVAALPLAAVCGPASARIVDGWFARSELGMEGPTCALFARGAIESQGASTPAMLFTIVWTAREGPLLWLNGLLAGVPSVRLETVGTDHHWDVTFDQRGQPGMAARHAVISADELDRLIEGVGLGHGLAITVQHADQAPLRYLDAPEDRKVAVAMYRACVKSMIENPPPAYSQQPRMSLFQLVDYSECGFRHIFTDQPFPPYITLLVGSTGGTIVFDRQTVELGAHASVRARRKTPDRVDAETLFGNRFDLVQTFDYRLTLAQVDGLLADMSSGKSRRVTLTSPKGETSTLEFGGPYSRSSAAMLNACRAVKFAED